MKSMFRIEFIDGTDIEEVIIEAMQIAQRTIINVVFNFNGVEIFITPISIKKDLLQNYENEIAIHKQQYMEKFK